MAVQSLYFSDRDGLEMALSNPDTMLFQSKAEADARDKVLELAENVALWLEKHVDGISEDLAEKCAMSIAENKDLFARAMKKPELLTEVAAAES
ncbi:YebG family protein [Marinobacter sp. SS5-14b]|uniref:YebG family protein n=1 Tax=Marinobacter sp. SS5-14b TaxID=3050456 RepID=UPI0026DF276E|nr:YebG family protein [Marinobacter sp. SS5-14b]